jgi:hypothetical protein
VTTPSGFSGGDRMIFWAQSSILGAPQGAESVYSAATSADFPTS